MGRAALFRTILKKQNAMKLEFTLFPVIKKTMQRIAIENANESSIIFFQSFLYANIPLCAQFLPSKVSCGFYFLSSRNCKAGM